MVYVAELARLAGRLADDDASTGTARCCAARPADVLPRRPLAELLDAMRLDKKARGDLLRFVVLDGWPGPRASRARTRRCSSRRTRRSRERPSPAAVALARARGDHAA